MAYSDPVSVVDFPPMLNQLTKDVGKKDELTVFIPKGSRLYRNLLIKSGQYKNDSNFPEDLDYQGYKNTGPDMAYIRNMTIKDKGLSIVIDVKNSPLSRFYVADNDSRYSVLYTYGQGTVLSIQFLTQSDYSDDISYLYKKYTNSLIANGYETASWIEHFQTLRSYEKDNKIIKLIDSNYVNFPYRVQGYFAVLEIYDKDVYNNYNQVLKEIKNKDLDVTYSQLDKLIK